MPELGIADILFDTGVVSAKDRDRLAISGHFGGQHNSPSAATMRFLARLDDRLICSVKRLAINGAYDTGAILETQRLYGTFSSICVPKIISTVQQGGYFLIIEEPVEQAITLDQAVQNGQLKREEAEAIIGNCMREAYEKQIASPSSGIKHVITDDPISQAVLSSSLAGDYQQQLAEIWSRTIPLTPHVPIRTSRDFLPRNFLLSGGRPWLVDFDLSGRTAYFAMDLLRVEHYTGWSIPFWPVEWNKAQKPLIALYAILLEESLQRSLLTESGYREWVEPRVGIFRKMASEVISPTDPSVAKPAAPLIVPRQEDKNVFQVYFTNDKTYMEEASVAEYYEFSDSPRVFKFELPPIAFKTLRIDPADRPTALKVNSLYLVSGGKSLNLLNPDILKPIQQLRFYPVDDQWIFLCTGDDACLEIDAAELQGFRPMSLVIEIASAQPGLDPTTAIRQMEIVQAKIASQQAINEALRKQLIEEKASGEQRLAELNAMKEKVASLQREVADTRAFYEQSKSWRITAPMRSMMTLFRGWEPSNKTWLGRNVRRLVRQGKKSVRFGINLITTWRSSVHLKPISGVQSLGGHCWKALDDDPTFEVVGQIPFGPWVYLQADLETDRPGWFKLYLDDGGGFRESHIIAIPISNAGRQTISQRITIPEDTRRLRFDPIDSRGPFTLASFSLQHRPLRVIAPVFSAIFHRLHYIYFQCVSRFNRLRNRFTAVSETIEPTTVVIPVYNGHDETIACIDSVLKNTPANVNVIVIDDCSPDPRVNESLCRLASKAPKNLKIFRNRSNHGFVATVNRGMQIARGHVILLNSDTEVPPGWVERLLQTYRTNPRSIGTITPMSNNATICSFPNFCQDNEIPAGIGLDGMDKLFAENPVSPIDLPTAVGFCMFISRRCLNRVGLFDEKVFGRGYGEENDFCMRAWRWGFRSVLCSNLFIRHKGRVSFTEAGKPLLAENLKKLQAKHPYYGRAVQRFVKKDPIAPVRQAVMEKIRNSDAVQRGNQPGVLYILPDQLIGGTERHLHDLAGGLMYSMRVHIARPGEQGVRFESFAPAPLTTISRCRPLAGIMEAMHEYIEKNHIQLVHLQHLVPMDVRLLEFFKQLRVPYCVTLHDYSAVCPSYNLLDRSDNTLCSTRNDASACVRCMPGNSNAPAAYRSCSTLTWRKQWLDLLRGAKSVFCPSPAAAEVVHLYYPDIATTVIEHGLDISIYGKPIQVDWSKRQQGPLNVAILGGINKAKGSRLVMELAKEAEKQNWPFRLIIIGPCDILPGSGEHFGGRLTVTGNYSPNELGRLLNEYRIDVGLLPSIWPETFCYTLSECWLHGIPVIGSSLGAIGARLKASGGGWVLPELSMHAMAELICQLHAQPEQITMARQAVSQIGTRTVQDMCHVYFTLYKGFLADKPKAGLVSAGLNVKS